MTAFFLPDVAPIVYHDGSGKLSKLCYHFPLREITETAGIGDSINKEMDLLPVVNGEKLSFMPKYVAWFLRHPSSQTHTRTVAYGKYGDSRYLFAYEYRSDIFGSTGYYSSSVDNLARRFFVKEQFMVFALTLAASVADSALNVFDIILGYDDY